MTKKKAPPPLPKIDGQFLTEMSYSTMREVLREKGIKLEKVFKYLQRAVRCPRASMLALIEALESERVGSKPKDRTSFYIDQAILVGNRDFIERFLRRCNIENVKTRTTEGR